MGILWAHMGALGCIVLTLLSLCGFAPPSVSPGQTGREDPAQERGGGKAAEGNGAEETARPSGEDQVTTTKADTHLHSL